MAEENTNTSTTTEPQAPEKTDNGNTAPAKEEKKAPAPQPEKTFTQAEVNRIIDERLTREREKQEEAAKLAAMNEKEKSDYTIKKLTEELNGYKARENRAAMAREAHAMLSDKGLGGISDELVDRLINETDAEATKKNVEDFAAMFTNAVDEAVKARLRGKTPEVGAPASQLTQEQIFAVKDRATRQRLIRENMDLFTQK